MQQILNYLTVPPYLTPGQSLIYYEETTLVWFFSVVSRRNYKRNPQEKLFPVSGNAEKNTVVILMCLKKKKNTAPVRNSKYCLMLKTQSH